VGTGHAHPAVGLELGYARDSTTKQSLEHQLNALAAAGTPAQRIYAENKTDATVDRPGLAALLGYTRGSDTIVVHTLDATSARSSTSCMHEAPSGVSGRGRGGSVALAEARQARCCRHLV
jgi:resolvase-like protein